MSRRFLNVIYVCLRKLTTLVNLQHIHLDKAILAKKPELLNEELLKVRLNSEVILKVNYEKAEAKAEDYVS